MKDKPKPQEISKDYQEFLLSGEIEPPKKLTNQIFAQVHQDLHPGWISVLSKLAFIHAVVGTLTLLFCPYSELYSIESFNLMKLLMGFGEQVCMIGCGAVYFGGSALVASFALRPEEVQSIRKTWVLQLPAIALLSTGIFIALGLLYLQGLFLFWVLGSILGGLITLELGWAIRIWLRSSNLIH